MIFFIAMCTCIRHPNASFHRDSIMQAPSTPVSKDGESSMEYSTPPFWRHFKRGRATLCAYLSTKIAGLE